MYFTGECLGTFVTELGVTCCQISAEGDCVVIGTLGSHDIITLRPPNSQSQRSTDTVYGDASREGKVFDLSGAG